MQVSPMPKQSDRAKSAAIVSRPGQPEVARILPGVMDWFRAHNYQMVVDPQTAEYAKGQEVVPRSQMSTRPLDLVLVLGGDGTFLSAARAMAATDVPLLGVNLGSLGFLTEVPLPALYPTLEAICQGRGTIESRSLIQCTLFRGPENLGSYQVLNDVVLNKTAMARLNNYDLSVDKVFVSSYRADGMIVATPTGSTAYSLSAGGPVLMPKVDAFVITPVSPHSLSHRPLVVPDSAEIEIVLKGNAEEAYLSLDGQPGVALRDADRVRCSRSAHKINLFRTGTDFFEVLRTKLKWGENNPI
jgi:NAD+ kinase